jgi:hypothetical protein
MRFLLARDATLLTERGITFHFLVDGASDKSEILVARNRVKHDRVCDTALPQIKGPG